MGRGKVNIAGKNEDPAIRSKSSAFSMRHRQSSGFSMKLPSMAVLPRSTIPLTSGSKLAKGRAGSTDSLRNTVTWPSTRNSALPERR